MRSLTMAATRLGVLGALLLAGVPRAAAQAPPAGQETGNEESPASPEFGIGVTLGSYTATGTAQGGSEAQPGAPVAVAWTAVGPELIGLRGVSGTLPDGAPCMSLVAQAFPTAETASGTVQNLTALRDLGALGRACPGTPSVSPQMLAVSFWERAGLPVPAPYVAPGWMITGMRAYLEANSSATASFAYPTPFGTLAIDAWTEDLVVNWATGPGGSGTTRWAGRIRTETSCTSTRTRGASTSP